MKVNRLLVLNTEVSGMNRFLFQSLREKGWELEICDIPLPKRAVYWAYFSTFNFNLRTWRKSCSAKLDSYLKSPRIFSQRTKSCEKVLKEKWRTGDLILQIAGLFAPALKKDNLPGPYAVFLSFTTKLAEREYPPWVSFASSKDREAWYEWETYLYRSADLIVTTNAHAKNSLINDYQASAGNISVIGYGVNLDKVEYKENSHAGNKILFIGYDFERKGGPTILKAFSVLKQSLPDAELTIVGPKAPETVAPGINWLGPVGDRQRIVRLLQEATVFVMPSICEPFGLVLLEAMAYGLPCIGSTCDAMPEIINEGETGYLIKAGDVNSLAERMKLLLNDRELWRRFSKAAVRRVHETFTWELVGARVSTAINQKFNQANSGHGDNDG